MGDNYRQYARPAEDYGQYAPAVDDYVQYEQAVEDAGQNEQVVEAAQSVEEMYHRLYNGYMLPDEVESQPLVIGSLDSPNVTDAAIQEFIDSVFPELFEEDGHSIDTVMGRNSAREFNFEFIKECSPPSSVREVGRAVTVLNSILRHGLPGTGITLSGILDNLIARRDTARKFDTKHGIRGDSLSKTLKSDTNLRNLIDSISANIKSPSVETGKVSRLLTALAGNAFPESSTLRNQFDIVRDAFRYVQTATTGSELEMSLYSLLENFASCLVLFAAFCLQPPVTELFVAYLEVQRDDQFALSFTKYLVPRFRDLVVAMSNAAFVYTHESETYAATHSLLVDQPRNVTNLGYVDMYLMAGPSRLNVINLEHTVAVEGALSRSEVIDATIKFVNERFSQSESRLPYIRVAIYCIPINSATPFNHLFTEIRFVDCIDIDKPTMTPLGRTLDARVVERVIVLQTPARQIKAGLGSGPVKYDSLNAITGVACRVVNICIEVESFIPPSVPSDRTAITPEYWGYSISLDKNCLGANMKTLIIQGAGVQVFSDLKTDQLKKLSYVYFTHVFQRDLYQLKRFGRAGADRREVQYTPNTDFALVRLLMRVMFNDPNNVFLVESFSNAEENDLCIQEVSGVFGILSAKILEVYGIADDAGRAVAVNELTMQLYRCLLALTPFYHDHLWLPRIPVKLRGFPMSHLIQMVNPGVSTWQEVLFTIEIEKILIAANNDDTNAADFTYCRAMLPNGYFYRLLASTMRFPFMTNEIGGYRPETDLLLMQRSWPVNVHHRETLVSQIPFFTHHFAHFYERMHGADTLTLQGVVQIFQDYVSMIRDSDTYERTSEPRRVQSYPCNFNNKRSLMIAWLTAVSVFYECACVDAISTAISLLSAIHESRIATGRPATAFDSHDAEEDNVTEEAMRLRMLGVSHRQAIEYLSDLAERTGASWALRLLHYGKFKNADAGTTSAQSNPDIERPYFNDPSDVRSGDYVWAHKEPLPTSSTLSNIFNAATADLVEAAVPADLQQRVPVVVAPQTFALPKFMRQA